MYSEYKELLKKMISLAIPTILVAIGIVLFLAWLAVYCDANGYKKGYKAGVKWGTKDTRNHCNLYHAKNAESAMIHLGLAERVFHKKRGPMIIWVKGKRKGKEIGRIV